MHPTARLRISEVMGQAMTGRRLSECTSTQSCFRPSWLRAFSLGMHAPATIVPLSLLDSKSSTINVELLIVDRRRAWAPPWDPDWACTDGEQSSEGGETDGSDNDVDDGELAAERLQRGFYVAMRVTNPLDAQPPLAMEVVPMPSVIDRRTTQRRSTGESSAYSSGRFTLQSMRQPTLRVNACSMPELLELLPQSVRPQEGTEIFQQAASLLLKEAIGGALLIVAPIECFHETFGGAGRSSRALEQGDESQPVIRTCDGGYMTRRLKDYHVSDQRFVAAFREFTAHSVSDRWPDDHHDEAARGQPKDGAILVSISGYCVKAAAKILGLRPPRVWQFVGTKHEAALACAWHIRNSLVLVRSEGSAVHCLVRDGDDVQAHRVLGEEYPAS